MALGAGQGGLGSMYKGRGTSWSAVFQELQVKGAPEGRGWKGELGSNMGGLMDLELDPKILGHRLFSACSFFMHFTLVLSGNSLENTL